MKALIWKRITRTPLNAPAAAPKPIASSRVSQVSSSCPDAEPRLAASQAASMAANAMTNSTERSMWPGDDAERQADRDQADEGRVLQDVEEDAELEEALDGQREDDQDDREDQPDQVVEQEIDQLDAIRPEGPLGAARSNRHAATTSVLSRSAGPRLSGARRRSPSRR